MRQVMQVFGVLVLVLVGSALLPHVAQAGCVETVDGVINGSADTINCTDPILATFNISAQGGDDTITNSGAFSNIASIGGGDDNDTIINSGTFSYNSGIIGDDGNDTISNSGAFTNTSGILGGAGNDTIILLPGSRFDATSYVDGDIRNSVPLGQDVLILHNTVPITIPNLTPCHNLVFVADMQANGCFVPWEGGVLYFVNFESIQLILVAILEEQGISVSLPPVPTVICEDGRVKVFKLPNGDVEYYSGFDVRPTNGFLVGKVTLAELANSVRAFSDPNALGWSVVVSQNGSVLSGQVFDANNNPVGNTCRH